MTSYFCGTGIRGLQALSGQFRFAFSKPFSSQTRFLNRPVAAPAEVAHFCHYNFFYFSTNLRFEGWILETILLSIQYPLTLIFIFVPLAVQISMRNFEDSPITPSRGRRRRSRLLQGKVYPYGGDS